MANTRAYYCLECGLCTGTCPVSRYDPLYSPRLTVERALLFGDKDVVCDKEIWSCLTCGTCNLRCPSTVDYTAFMRQARARARQVGERGLCTHAEKIEAILELQRLPTTRRSSAWLGRAAKLRKKSDTYYFAGCLPYLDVVFREIGFEGTAIGRASVALLNSLGIVPAVSESEVCCGHDSYWTGEVTSVRDLARRNVAAIRSTGARRVVFSCPECYYMFKQVYPTFLGDLGFEPVLLLSLLAESLPQWVAEGSASAKLVPAGQAAAAASGGVSESVDASEVGKVRVTYQDPCRLAKHDDITKEPREVLRALPGLELVEMRRSGKDALCCGSSSWTSCSRVNKKIQVERLEEAAETGAQVMVTACPKCNIHLRCALRDKDSKSEIRIADITTIIAESLRGGKSGG